MKTKRQKYSRKLFSLREDILPERTDFKMWNFSIVTVNCFMQVLGVPDFSVLGVDVMYLRIYSLCKFNAQHFLVNH